MEEFRIRVKSHENRYPAFIQQVHILAKRVISMRDMVEQEVVPLANQTAGESLTAIDTNRVLELAEENGIQLSEEAKDKIRRGFNR